MVTALGWLLALMIAGWLFSWALAAAADGHECECGALSDPDDPCGLCPECRRNAAIADGACWLCAEDTAVDEGLCAGCSAMFDTTFGG